MYPFSLPLVLLLLSLPQTLWASTSVTQYGITWTFDREYQTGQFVNGDYWVVDPGTGVKIIGISPGHALRMPEEGDKNGSMINPQEGQGYDESMVYTESLNVGRSVSPSTPLVLTGVQSLVSTISADPLEGLNPSYVKTASVLTSVTSPPADGAFRPGISGSLKTFHNVSSINWTKLKSLATTIAKPNISTLAAKFKMVWLIHQNAWQSRYMRPADSGLNNYYYPADFSTAALAMHLDYTLEEKRELVINYIQVGIDLYSYINKDPPQTWGADGGHYSSRKWPVLLAGILLNDSGMRNAGLTFGRIGNEDWQTFYVTQTTVDTPPYPGFNSYTTDMIGMPEWMDKGTRLGSGWDDSPYRNIASGAPVWSATALAAKLMGAKELWNYAPYFDYVERYMAINKGDPDPFGYTVPDQSKLLSRGTPLMQEMYDTYYFNIPAGRQRCRLGGILAFPQDSP